ncbi:hypothetical protein HYW76_01785 [Candidatus Pacearchaeota archaeon]|nr:hypothetical protein [Candidatus Pacearchaeota archaeon]
MPKVERVIEEVKDILKKDNRGLTIQEISKLTGVSRITAMVALARLEGQNSIDVRIIGNCKLHYLKEVRKSKL